MRRGRGDRTGRRFGDRRAEEFCHAGIAPIVHVQLVRRYEVGEGQIQCKRCGKIKPQLPKPPMRNAFGQEVFENTCPDCWRDAIGQGTKVINELRLPLNDPQADKIWDQHIREFLNLV